MHEGQKLKKILEERGYNVSALAEACGVKWPAAKKYIDAETIGGNAWLTCSAGLKRLGIDPALLRPGTVTMHRARDLRPLIGDFSRRQLEALKQILEADAEARDRLLWILDDRLSRHP
jgi:hypothetical protein